MTARKLTQTTIPTPKGAVALVAVASCGVAPCQAGISVLLPKPVSTRELQDWARRHGWRYTRGTIFCPKHVETARQSSDVVDEITKEAKAGRWPQ